MFFPRFFSLVLHLKDDSADLCNFLPASAALNTLFLKPLRPDSSGGLDVVAFLSPGGWTL